MGTVGLGYLALLGGSGEEGDVFEGFFSPRCSIWGVFSPFSYF